MKVSVNIVVRNESQRLKVLIPLLTKQGFEDIVVVDQESTDDTFVLCKSYGCNTILDRATGYSESSRQLAMDNSKYDWVLIVDADEYVTTRFAQDIPTLIQEPVDGVMCCLAQFRYVDYDLDTILSFGDRIDYPHVSLPYRYRLAKRDSLWIVNRLHGGVGPLHYKKMLHLHYNGIVEIKNLEEENIDRRRYEAIEKGFYTPEFI